MVSLLLFLLGVQAGHKSKPAPWWHIRDQIYKPNLPCPERAKVEQLISGPMWMETIHELVARVMDPILAFLSKARSVAAKIGP